MIESEDYPVINLCKNFLNFGFYLNQEQINYRTGTEVQDAKVKRDSHHKQYHHEEVHNQIEDAQIETN